MLKKYNYNNKKNMNISVLFSVFSSFFALLTASVVGFFLPRFTSVETYALYRTFGICYGFLGFFHLGFVDGVYLKYGGVDYEDLPARRFRMYFRFIICFISIMQFALCLGCFCFLGKNALKSPFFLSSICLIPCVINAYFGYIEQSTKRFLIDGFAQMMQNIITIVGFSILIFLKNDNYIYFVMIMFVAYLIMLLYHIINNKEIIVGEADRIIPNFNDIKDTTGRGFFIMLSQFISIFIFSFDSLIVRTFLITKEFAMYTFAVSVVTFMFQLTAVISKLIFPFLKRMKKDDYPDFYLKMKIYVIFFASAIAGFSFIFGMFVPLIIPEYTSSISILKILGASVIFKSAQELVCGNYFKVLDYERLYARINVLAFIFSVVFDVVAFALFRSSISVACASVLTFMIWLFISDLMLRKKMKIKHSFDFFVIVLVMLLYYICMIPNSIIGIIIYYLSVSILFFAVEKKYPMHKNAR